MKRDGLLRICANRKKTEAFALVVTFQCYYWITLVAHFINLIQQ